MTPPRGPGEPHEAWLARLVNAAKKRDAKAGSGDQSDFAMTIARIVYRETRRELLGRAEAAEAELAILRERAPAEENTAILQALIDEVKALRAQIKHGTLTAGESWSIAADRNPADAAWVVVDSKGRVVCRCEGPSSDEHAARIVEWSRAAVSPGIKSPQTSSPVEHSTPPLPEGCTCPLDVLQRFREDTTDTGTARVLAGCDTEIHRAAGRAALRRAGEEKK